METSERSDGRMAAEVISLAKVREAYLAAARCEREADEWDDTTADTLRRFAHDLRERACGNTPGPAPKAGDAGF